VKEYTIEDLENEYDNMLPDGSDHDIYFSNAMAEFTWRKIVDLTNKNIELEEKVESLIHNQKGIIKIIEVINE
jgi:hypothetical protein